MKYTVIHTDHFEKSLEFVFNKYPHKKFIEELEKLGENLSNGIFEGEAIPNMHFKKNTKVFKLRMSNPGGHCGKRSGFRVIYYTVLDDKEVYLLDIYSKNKKTDIDNEEIKRILENENIIK